MLMMWFISAWRITQDLNDSTLLIPFRRIYLPTFNRACVPCLPVSKNHTLAQHPFWLSERRPGFPRPSYLVGEPATKLSGRHFSTPLADQRGHADSTQEDLQPPSEGTPPRWELSRHRLRQQTHAGQVINGIIQV